MHRRLMEVIAARPSTRVVNSIDGHVERTYLDLVAAITA